MTLEELILLDIARKVVYIIGRAGAGKTHVANLFKKKHTYVFHADDHLENPYYLEEQIFKMAESLAKRYDGGCIIEGCACYSLLLKGAEEKTFRPDIIIDVQISTGKQREVYINSRDPEKLKYQNRFYRMCLSKLNEYYRICPEKELPTILTINNDY